MRAVTAMILAALTGLSALASIASLVFVPGVIFAKESAAPVEQVESMPPAFVASNSALEPFWIPITLIVAAFFLGFACLCWWLAKTVWPNRIFAG